MGRFEIEMEITGLKFRIKGERADIVNVPSNLAEQLGGLFAPASAIVDGLPSAKQIESTAIIPEAAKNGNGKTRIAKSRRPTTTSTDTNSIINWTHNPDKWGNPRQAWTSGKKTLWLLYVIKQETAHGELTAAQIVDTFNKFFPEARLLRKTNMPRDLGALKQRTPALLGDRPNLSPVTWFLTEEGIKEAVKLVAEVRGGSTLYPQNSESQAG